MFYFCHGGRRHCVSFDIQTCVPTVHMPTRWKVSVCLCACALSTHHVRTRATDTRLEHRVSPGERVDTATNRSRAEWAEPQEFWRRRQSEVSPLPHHSVALHPAPPRTEPKPAFSKVRLINGRARVRNKNIIKKYASILCLPFVTLCFRLAANYTHGWAESDTSFKEKDSHRCMQTC